MIIHSHKYLRTLHRSSYPSRAVLSLRVAVCAILTRLGPVSDESEGKICIYAARSVQLCDRSTFGLCYAVIVVLEAPNHMGLKANTLLDLMPRIRLIDVFDVDDMAMTLLALRLPTNCPMPNFQNNPLVVSLA